MSEKKAGISAQVIRPAVGSGSFGQRELFYQLSSEVSLDRRCGRCSESVIHLLSRILSSTRRDTPIFRHLQNQCNSCSALMIIEGWLFGCIVKATRKSWKIRLMIDLQNLMVYSSE